MLQCLHLGLHCATVLAEKHTGLHSIIKSKKCSVGCCNDSSDDNVSFEKISLRFRLHHLTIAKKISRAFHWLYAITEYIVLYMVSLTNSASLLIMQVLMHLNQAPVSSCNATCLLCEKLLQEFSVWQWMQKISLVERHYVCIQKGHSCCKALQYKVIIRHASIIFTCSPKH